MESVRGRTYWLGLFVQELPVNLIHGSKVLHIGQENINLDHFVKIGAGFLKDGSEVAEDLSL